MEGLGSRVPVDYSPQTMPDAAGMEGSTVLERMAACLPCASWPCAGGGSSRHWQLWPGDFDDDAQPILTAPTPALAECLIPPSVSSLYDDRGQSSPESSAPSWDIGAGRPPAHQVRDYQAVTHATCAVSVGDCPAYLSTHQARNYIKRFSGGSADKLQSTPCGIARSKQERELSSCTWCLGTKVLCGYIEVLNGTALISYCPV